MRTLVCVTLFCITVLTVAGLNMVQASTLATTSWAFDNGAGPAGGVWQGSQNYSGLFTNGTVEFAVFAPGDFQNFLDDNGIDYSDPAPSEYIYAYQAVSIGSGTSLVTFTVGLQEDEDLGSTGVAYIPAATDYGTYPHVPIKNPAATTGGPGVGDSSAWQALPSFAAGEVTPILYYSSPQVPELGFSTYAGLTAVQIADSMPNPVPEPATLVLCLVSGLGGLLVRRGR